MTNFEQGVQAVKHEAKKLKWIESGATNCVEAVGVPGSKKNSPWIMLLQGSGCVVFNGPPKEECFLRNGRRVNERQILKTTPIKVFNNVQPQSEKAGKNK